MNLIVILLVQTSLLSVCHCGLISIDGIYVKGAKSLPRLQCKITGFNVSQIKWYRNNKEIKDKDAIKTHSHIDGVFHSNVSFLRVDDSKLGSIYQCRVYSGELLLFSSTLKLQASPHIDIQMDEQSIYVKEGETVKLNCSVWGNPLPTLRWKARHVQLKMQPIEVKNSYHKSLIAILENFNNDYIGDYVCESNNTFSEETKKVHLRMRNSRKIIIPAVIFAIVCFIVFVIAALSEALGVLANKIKIK